MPLAIEIWISVLAASAGVTCLIQGGLQIFCKTFFKLKSQILTEKRIQNKNDGETVDSMSHTAEIRHGITMGPRNYQPTLSCSPSPQPPQISRSRSPQPLRTRRYSADHMSPRHFDFNSVY